MGSAKAIGDYFLNELKTFCPNSFDGTNSRLASLQNINFSNIQILQGICNLFQDINRNGTAILMATHNHSFVTNYPHRILKCEEGKLLDSEKEEFEYAAQVRDYVKVLKEFLEFSQQKNVELDSPTANIDILAFHPGEIEIDIAIYMVRNGILLGHKNFHFPTIECQDDLEEELIRFFFQYYSNSHDSFPDNIITI